MDGMGMGMGMGMNGDGDQYMISDEYINLMGMGEPETDWMGRNS